jgi:hypothetical protein
LANKVSAPNSKAAQIRKESSLFFILGVFTINKNIDAVNVFTMHVLKNGNNTLAHEKIIATNCIHCGRSNKTSEKALKMQISLQSTS